MLRAAIGIQAATRRKGRTQGEVASSIPPVTQTDMSNFETGARFIKIARARAILHELGVPKRKALGDLYEALIAFG
jgi:hypothetical protein